MKQRINKEFIDAFKAKETFKKDVLGMLKTKITEAEKKDGKELSNDQIFNVINSSLKQVEQTIVATVSNTESKVYQDAILEKEILLTFLPKQMTEDEIRTEVVDFINDKKIDLSEKNKSMGMIMKFFKEKYNGKYNAGSLKSIVDKEIV